MDFSPCMMYVPLLLGGCLPSLRVQLAIIFGMQLIVNNFAELFGEFFYCLFVDLIEII